MSITLEQYLMGRGPIDSNKELNAIDLLCKVNNLIAGLCKEVDLEVSPNTNTIVSSGYRTPEVNKSIPGAAPRSKHMSCQAIDIYDPDGDIDEFITDELLEQFGLYREHPSATKGWVHLQSVPPKSGRRTFYP